MHGKAISCFYDEESEKKVPDKSRKTRELTGSGFEKKVKCYVPGLHPPIP
jgi:hypothetical protein